MREFEIRTGRDMVRVAWCAVAIAALVLLFAFGAEPPWSVIGGFCAGFLAVFATCYFIVGTRIIREAMR